MLDRALVTPRNDKSELRPVIASSGGDPTDPCSPPVARAWIESLTDDELPIRLAREFGWGNGHTEDALRHVQ